MEDGGDGTTTTTTHNKNNKNGNENKYTIKGIIRKLCVGYTYNIQDNY
jgi:hypothetical protein